MGTPLQLGQLSAEDSGQIVGADSWAESLLPKVDRQWLDELSGEGQEAEDAYPLSPMQHGMLFHSVLTPESGEYLEQIACTVEERLDPSAFRQAWKEVLDHHSSLRTVFVWEGLKSLCKWSTGNRCFRFRSLI